MAVVNVYRKKKKQWFKVYSSRNTAKSAADALSAKTVNHVVRQAVPIERIKAIVRGIGMNNQRIIKGSVDYRRTKGRRMLQAFGSNNLSRLPQKRWM